VCLWFAIIGRMIIASKEKDMDRIIGEDIAKDIVRI